MTKVPAGAFRMYKIVKIQYGVGGVKSMTLPFL